ncbi:hypothetical protein AB1N83_011608 [Pleurotus pulmonarius]
MEAISSNFSALFLGNLFATIFYGITTQQTFTYFKLNSAHDTTTLRLQIAFLWLLDGIHIAFITHSVYSCAAWSTTSLEAVRPVWSISAQVFIMTFSDFLVRGIFASRVWIVSRKNVFMVVPIAALSTVNFILGLVLASKLLKIPTFSELWSTNIQPAMYSNLASGVAADLSIAVALVFWLLKSRTGFKRTDSLLNTMMVYAVNTGLLTTICGFTSLVTYAARRNDLVFLGFFFVLSELLINAMLASFNARQCMRRDASGVTSIHSSQIDSNVSGKPIISGHVGSGTGHAMKPLVIDIQQEVHTSRDTEKIAEVYNTSADAE